MRNLESNICIASQTKSTQSIDSWMNILISKYDKVDNNSEVENLIFELHSLKTKRNKSWHSKGRDKDQVEINNRFEYNFYCRVQPLLQIFLFVKVQKPTEYQ